MEIPFLACSTILSLDHEVSTKIIDVSMFSEVRDDIEVLVDNEAPISVPLTGGWFTLPVLGIDKVPLLFRSSVEDGHVNISIFSVNTS
jgi:hypothetical protein